jgi:hypothetical protein
MRDQKKTIRAMRAAGERSAEDKDATRAAAASQYLRLRVSKLPQSPKHVIFFS